MRVELESSGSRRNSDAVSKVMEHASALFMMVVLERDGTSRPVEVVRVREAEVEFAEADAGPATVGGAPNKNLLPFSFAEKGISDCVFADNP